MPFQFTVSNYTPMSKFTLQEFRLQYKNDAACLDKIFRMRYGSLTHCPACKEETKFRRVTTRRCYQCRKCYTQFYPTAGTIFEKTRVPLSDWFYIIFLFSTTRNGVAAKEIERLLGVTYKCAFRMSHQIRKLLAEVPQEKLSGIVEIDESWIAGSQANSLYRKVPEAKTVFGMVARLGEARVFSVDNIHKETLLPLIKQNIEANSRIHSDEYSGYKSLPKEGYQHDSVKHSMKEYVRGNVSTNTIEGYFSQLKRMISGTHIHVSERYIQNYINECTFRYNNRNNPHQMFNIILNKIQSI